MVAPYFRRWRGKGRRRTWHFSSLVFAFPLVVVPFLFTLVITVSSAVGEVQIGSQQSLSGKISSNVSRNGTESEDSGSWEYYYVDDDEEDATSSNSTSTPGSKNSTVAATSRTGRASNSTRGKSGGEYYYYMEEETLMDPKNASSKVIKTTTLKIDKTHTGEGKKEPLKAGSMLPFLGMGIDGNHISDLIALPSVEPFKQLATPIDVEGPVYTDYNYGQDNYRYSGPDSALSRPLGHGEFPKSPFTQVEPGLLRPPSPGLTSVAAGVQPPAESGINLDVVKNVEYIDGIDNYKNSLSNYDNNDQDSKKKPEGDLISSLLLPNLPNLRTKLKVEAYGNVPSLAAEKNPILQAKQFFYHLWEILTNLSKTELVLWAEKAFNVIAELSIPEEHYVRVISFVGVYLFVSMLTYGAQDVVDVMCTIETADMPMKSWNYHAARRFVPARSVDPKIQRKFLKLFRGEKYDDDEEEEEEEAELILDDNNSLKSSSSEEEFSDELDHINDLCSDDTFFYSLNPRHIEAYTLLQRILVAQESPKKFLKLAKKLLLKKKVHPKVWYFGVVGAYLSRADLTGFSIVHPLDAIPDWYIPAELITKLMQSYRSIRVKRAIRSSRFSSKNITAISNAVATLHFSQEDDEASLENLPFLNLPVKSDKGNYTVTIITSNKKKNEKQDDESSQSSSSSSDISLISVPSSEEASNSVEPTNSVEPKDQTTSQTEAETTPEPPRYKVAPKTKVAPKPKFTVTPKSKVAAKKKVTQSNKTALLKTKGTTSARPTVKVKGIKGDTSDLVVVKSATGKGNGTNEYVLDSRGHGKKGKGKKGKKCIKINWKVGMDNGVENALWYFREDLMLNQHHWYWHMTHPLNTTEHADRRAELFFYMHRSMVARYTAERLSNGLKKVQPLKFRQRGLIEAGYNSHLADINSGTYWTPRWPKTPLSDIYHDHDPDFAANVTLTYYDMLCYRLVKAIRSGRLMPTYGPPVPINNPMGINSLANTIEASDISVNPMFYDTAGIHGLGHVMIGLAADPDFRKKKVSGVMADAAVSMRDPAFYSYHLFMDNIFELHKEQLPPYEVVGGEFPLLWKGVRITNVELISQGGPPKNELKTFWSQHRFDLSPGVDRSIKKGKKKGKKHTEMCAQHLDHEPFYFKIQIERQPCVKSRTGLGTVRIFMAPRYDEKGKRIPVKIQRRLMFPLDSFTVKLKIGMNTITRYAEDSSLTQPWTKSFKDLERGPDPSGAADFCGCGWPQHLYIPKGHAGGMVFDLFVMVTNYDIDYVPNDPKILETPETCNSAFIFCGVPRRRYPDRRPMGYPFDRPLFKSFNCPPGWTFSSVVCKSANLILHNPIDTLEEYVSKAPNMAMLKFKIRHDDEMQPEPARH